MAVLRKGANGAAVRRWQQFLYGQGLLQGSVDGDFGKKTLAATKAFQVKHKLTADGIVGNGTYGAAMQLGFEVIKSDSSGKASPNFPPMPQNVKGLNTRARVQLLGAIKAVPAPTAKNREAVKLIKPPPISKVNIPQLAGVRGAPRSGNVFFHRDAAEQLKAFFQAVEDKGLRDRVLTWGGSYAPRFIRGSTTVLSNHAWGSAFDLNVPYNGLGTRGALVGEKGSVRELVLIAAKYGFFWGGWWKKRPDPMHFEVFKLI